MSILVTSATRRSRSEPAARLVLEVDGGERGPLGVADDEALPIKFGS
jgi:hypothetical protein